MLRACCAAHLSVGLFVWKVYCGKTADCIRMPFAVVSGVGRRMGVLDGDGDRRGGRRSFGGEFEASHCNQRGFCDAAFLKFFEDLFRYGTGPNWRRGESRNSGHGWRDWASCSLHPGPGLTQPSMLSGSINEYRLRSGRYKGRYVRRCLVRAMYLSASAVAGKPEGAL